MKKRLTPLGLLICALALFGPAELWGQPGPPQPARTGKGGPIPVSQADLSWGGPLAPVTVVHFFDLQCPYSAKMRKSLEELKRSYGKRQLRVVYKHFPLPFHKLARPAAEAAVAVHRSRGARAAERFLDASFDTLRQSGDHVDALRAARIDPGGIERARARKGPAQKVDQDIAFGKSVGVSGTPATFINGIKVSGAQQLARLKEVVDQQLAAAKALRAQGVPSARVYAQLSKQNFASPPPPSRAPTPVAPSAAPSAAPAPSEVWRVPVGTSPTLGPRSAWVTLVVFSDFQCPFCSKLAPTLEQLHQKYGSKLRIAFKHNPLPFHKRAEPAAQLSMEAYRRRGPRGFWEAHDRLFAQQRKLEDADLEQLATELGLQPRSTMRAVKQQKHARQIEADQDLASDLEAAGTPTSYVNGRKLVGARPLADFEALIDEELDHARQLIAKGIQPHRIYSHIQKTAKTTPPPPKKNIPRPTKAQPSKGSRHAPVTIQIFSDFQCPFCGRVGPTMDRIEKEFAGKVRLVWRHLPLKFHNNARPAAVAAAEAYRQQGDAGFWRMHDLLFENQRSLDRASLLSYAKTAGLDRQAFENALDRDRHGPAIDRDVAIAQAAGISGTPAFVVNGYFISGAQPFSKFKKVIKRALREAGGRP